MCRELGPEVSKLMVSGSTYIKKKCALAATRIIKKVPELIDDFVDRVSPLLEERHHGRSYFGEQLIHSFRCHVGYSRSRRRNLNV